MYRVFHHEIRPIPNGQAGNNCNRRLLGEYSSVDDLTRRLPRDLDSLTRRVPFGPDAVGKLVFMQRRQVGMAGVVWDPIDDPRSTAQPLSTWAKRA